MILNAGRLEALDGTLQEEFVRLQNELQPTDREIEQVRTACEQILLQGQAIRAERSLYERLEEDVIFAIPELLASLNSDLLDLSLVQARGPLRLNRPGAGRPGHESGPGHRGRKSPRLDERPSCTRRLLAVDCLCGE